MPLNTTDNKEIKLFNSLADEWWDEEGSMSFLHSMSEIRTKFILEELTNKFQIKNKHKILNDLDILDLGCGGGIASEPLCRLGGNVTGIDESENLINIAKLHSKRMGLKINYKCMDIENLIKLKKKYDVIVALELLEHVNNVEHFCELIIKLLKNDGIIILSTINRTILSKFFVIEIAENIIKKIPKGTHDYKKFITPEQLRAIFEKYTYEINNIKGMTWSPISNTWRLTRNTPINYILSLSKK
ncbi:MAG: bifunctional 3-demethylubiquinol 3-O-methyltransferase/2-polyprenyl-6-hydroxyphenol methylase [Pelagibacterales bacterium]|nr:bifunctional 3-demethylubiquinol 3-O-methyltransferase/2-polyprenyl-6-hydroxyphenol methylase [Pelagibacterales bacterium]